MITCFLGANMIASICPHTWFMEVSAHSHTGTCCCGLVACSCYSEKVQCKGVHHAPMFNLHKLFGQYYSSAPNAGMSTI